MPDPVPDPRSEPTPDSNLTPAQDDAVRALLASARHSAPTPPEVVARLEATLETLCEERREVRPETRAPVVTLAARRRRAAATLVLAAAAVVVAGFGIGQVLPSNMSGGDAGSSAESTTSDEDPLSTGGSDRSFAEDDSSDGGAAEKQGGTDMRTQETAPSPSHRTLADLKALDGASALKPQVRKLRARSDTAADFSADPACPLPDAGSGETLSVTYDGLPGALVFRAPVGSTQQVDLFLCGERDALRSLRLRAP
jgi:hypothetical protein